MWATVRRERVWIGVGLALVLAAGWATGAILNYVPHIGRTRITAVVLTLAIVMFAWHARRGEWFRPFGFPFLYAAVALMVPLLWLGVLRRPIGAVQPIDLTTPVVLVFSLTIIGWIAGTSVGLRATPAKSRPGTVSKERMLWLGRFFMLSA